MRQQFTLWMLFSLALVQVKAGIPFEQLETDIAMELILDEVRDDFGFIWVATRGLGLIRHNSYSATQYLHLATDTCSLSDNTVICMFMDSKHTLWVGTKHGLNRYNRSTDCFTSYYFDDADSLAYGQNIISDLFEDQHQQLWVVTAKSILRFNRQSNTFQSVVEWIDSDSEFEYCSMAQDAQGRYWVVTTRNGIYQLLPDQRKLSYYPDVAGAESPVNIKKVYIDSHNTIWIGSRYSGLYRFDPNGGIFTYFNSRGDGTGTNGTIVYDMLDDGEFLLVAVDQGGLNRYSYRTGKFDYITTSSGSSGSLTSDGIYSLYKDAEDILWMGTSRGGLNYYNPKKHRFQTYRKSENSRTATLAFDIVGCIYEDSKGKIWLGTDGGGISVFNPVTEQFVNYAHRSGQTGSLSSNIIRSIDEDRYGTLWIATFDKGINTHAASGVFKQVQPRFGEFSENDIIENLLVDSKGRFWLAYPHGAIVMLNANFRPVKQFFSNVSRHEIRRPIVQQLPNGSIYMLSNEGGFLYSESDSSFQKVFPVAEATILCADTKGNFYVGTYDQGIVKFSSSYQELCRYNSGNGLANNTVCYILEGNDGSIWASTMHGLSSINPENHAITNYYADDGLQGSQFFFQSGYKTRDGKLYFGGVNGFSCFYPDSIRKNREPAPVYIEDLFINNKQVLPGEPGSPLKLSLPATREITLSWRQNSITLHFAAINFTYPGKNTYSYMLEGFYNEWVYTHAENRRATYTNLSPGTYTFRVKATNNDHVGSNQEARLQITIVPPFWKRVWFFVLLGLMVVAGVFLFIAFRERMLIRDKKLLQQKVTERTRLISEQRDELDTKNKQLLIQKETLEMQKEELQTQKEMLQDHRDELEEKVRKRTIDLEEALLKAKQSDQLKTRFLANMSHEIRTPMNAIVGFSNLMDETEFTPEEKQHFVRVIRQNSEALLRLIQDILDISMIEADQLAIHHKTFALNEFFEKLKALYYPLANKQNLDIQFVNTQEAFNYQVYSDEARIRQVLTNLVNNAIKFTRAGQVLVDVQSSATQLIFRVKDTGRGLTKEEQEIIFEQFVKLEEGEPTATRGVGLGLSIAKKLSLLLGGDIRLKSEPGVGSEFIFSLPNQVLQSGNKENTPEIPQESHFNWKGKTILIIEDEEHNYEYLAASLRKTQARIVWAQNGLEATRLYLQYPTIDVVLLDIKMPHMDGYETLSWLKKQAPNQVIIAQTAYVHDEDRKRIRSAGFTDYISKPINVQELYQKIATYI